MSLFCARIAPRVNISFPGVAGRGAGQRVRGGAGLRVRAPDIRGVASPDLPLHQGRGRPLRHRHLLLGQLRQGWVSSAGDGKIGLKRRDLLLLD